MAQWLDTLIVVCVLAAAMAYVWKSYRAKALTGGACKSGCGGACGPVKQQTPALVQIGRRRS